MNDILPNIPIKYWSANDKPREKLVRIGRRNLTDAELIAILISSGNRQELAVELSKRILSSLSNDLGQLGRLSVKELSRFKGIGPAKAITIVAAIELGRRRKQLFASEKVAITGSHDAYTLLKHVFEDLPHEEFWVVLLNRANQVVAQQQISTGGQSATVADPKIIFRLAIEHRAASLVLAHNHPSGNLRPSKTDIALTSKLCAGAAMLDLLVLDHLIFGQSAYFSFADEGML